MNTAATVTRLKEEDQDFEWYPTTEKMIKAIRDHMKPNHQSHNEESKINADILDCGAGDGRVLAALTDMGERYAIEKSTILISQQPASVVPVGTDFHQSTLIDKKVDVIFSNPPYSEYEQWAVKIIKEANASDLYLILPDRWKNSEAIKAAIESRTPRLASEYAKRRGYSEDIANVIHSDDFLDADRAARAKVDIVHINLCQGYRNRHRGNDTDTDPFTIWFNETFPRPEVASTQPNQEKVKEAVKQELVKGRNLIDALVELYQRDMARLSRNYQAACALDPEVMEELKGLMEGYSSLPKILQKSLKQRIEGLKHTYWHEFFSNYESITERLTTKSRSRILDTLHSNVNVDFTSDNAYAITLWVIRNANQYYDSQLIDLVERMVSKANVVLYKSNQRTFGDEEWRYRFRDSSDKPAGLDRYKLDYRIVLHNSGGICTSTWEYERGRCNGLSERAAEWLNDIMAVAKTLGWNCRLSAGFAATHKWQSNKSINFICSSGEILMEAKAFKNGNMHIKFNQKFMRKLNVEFGRLKGWLKDHTQAADEMRMDPEEAREYWNGLQLIGNSAALMLTHQSADAFDSEAAENAQEPTQETFTPEPNPVQPKPEKKPQEPTEKAQPLTLAASPVDTEKPELQLALI